MKDIAFTKLGQSIKFNREYTPHGGDIDAPVLLRALANNNPDKNFYIVGLSDLSKLSKDKYTDLFPFHNVFDIYKGVKKSEFDYYPNSRTSSRYYPQTFVNSFFKDFGKEPDLLIVLPGAISTITIQGKIKQIKDPSLTASVITMAKLFLSPVTYWMNETIGKYPIVEIVTDPRYTLAGESNRDIIAKPTVTLSQYNGSYNRKSIKSYEDQSLIFSEHSFSYSGIEKIFLYDNPVNDISIGDRNTAFMIVLNEGSKPSRYNLLKEWVLNCISNVQIYGKWEHAMTDKDPRFMGSLPLDKIHQKLKSVRSTFIIPIRKGWVTSKYIEMIHAGVVPFFHPSYDEQNHLNAPAFLRVKTPDELYRKVDLLANDDELYLNVITGLRKMYISTNDTNGKKLSQTIFESVDSEYKLPDLSLYSKNENTTLESFF